ncbi:cytochrome c oxidase assembly protein COX11, mitochondrial [Morus notabilis]|uniref:cytochrome c oxidase assembly protein COX11, mitochondrial n=1 Tax=Morus notabilis TaxID=981085 RepID=UPI000CED0F7F|nr:cytochrome c oxidase assembly protein COX11, mitochondrial [Morus notabilis]XP_024021078.1 cytochrome c oxidase assembly protein COX11, mitochondrial [Morus notabilis]XP_024021079.1 cytochrome c oxidase assembly protein COX11, mitochondrial [Morus notabilis]XP_024021080.1 cytochrome c oxidase assembly protein COX11, mitochondrial [Morus notabilis]XP_024021081.1 cytochrome c oxidase assembly protein COX11, mitochondrial [Morus notabilis]XP_024021082.1 cytochrome c oxidase assembly protein CO
MSLSRLSRRAHLLPYLKHLHDVPLASRCLPHDLVSSSYSFTRGNNGYWRPVGYNIWRTELIHEFSTGSFDKYRQVSAHATKCFRKPYSLFSQHHYASVASNDQKSRKMLLYLTALVFAMVGCSYAAVPLYRRFCQATGYGGTIQRRESVEEKIARHANDGTVTTREIVVQFNADVADGMPWRFIPTQREVRVKPGESALAFYTAENRSSTAITGVSTYNVTPMKAAVYFNKIQCFCFEEQRLLPGEQIDMPVFFYIDPEFETDPRMDGINNLILSYTFFKVSEE